MVQEKAEAYVTGLEVQGAERGADGGQSLATVIPPGVPLAGGRWRPPPATACLSVF